jgi:hypothetical protein
MPDSEQPGPGGVQVQDHDAAYWNADGGSNWDKTKAEQFARDYWGPLAPDPSFESDIVPQTIESAEQAAAFDTAGADLIPSREDPNQNPARPDAGLIYPPHIPPGPQELGYGKWGEPAPFIPDLVNLRDQRIVIAIAERLVADQRPLLVQIKVAENAHLETWPFANGVIIGSSGQVPVQIGTRHANAAGYLIIASAAGLYVGTDQSVGTGNMGVPIPTGTVWLPIPANCNLFVTSAGVALAQATSVYLQQLFMGSTTLAGAEVGGG